jgi:hypothetical protein
MGLPDLVWRMVALAEPSVVTISELKWSPRLFFLNENTRNPFYKGQ